MKKSEWPAAAAVLRRLLEAFPADGSDQDKTLRERLKGAISAMEVKR